jgi:hypothetical protein
MMVIGVIRPAYAICTLFFQSLNIMHPLVILILVILI